MPGQLVNYWPFYSGTCYSIFPDLWNLNNFYFLLQNESFKKSVLTSLEVLEKCFQDFKVEEVSVAFNGGKDNIAMIHLVSAYLQNKFPNWNGHLEALYVEEKESFREVDEFMEGAKKNYNLELTKIERPMKTALGTFLKERPHIKAMVLGTRKGEK